MAKVVNPKVNVVDFGPRYEFNDGTVMTADEFVYGAASITYKDIGALQEYMEMKGKDPALEEKAKKALVKVAGAGHASMATTPGLWAFLEGTCSKLVDSMFTGARFGSSLMPSGRRIPISIDQIVIPESITSSKNKKNERIYLETSEANIKLYEELQENNVPKEEASKIVQYGHRGGGFMFMPLETLIYFSNLAERDPVSIPAEGLDIIEQIEEQMADMGMNIVYQARKAAPRTGAVNPNIFHKRKNLAQQVVETKFDELVKGPILHHVKYLENYERDEQLREYFRERDELFKSGDSEEILEFWPYLLGNLDDIVIDFNQTISVQTNALTPWRVWGEVKRHRTMPQTAESIYSAAERAHHIITKKGNLEGAVSIPGEVKKNPELLDKWENAFKNSVLTYGKLVDNEIPESDAIMVLPRGIKLGVVKEFDLFNLTLGYMSLRLCNTAEPEMRKTTEQERRLVQGLFGISDEVKELITPKCAYTGFCPEMTFERSCNRILPFVPEYNKEFHDKIQNSRIDEIENKL